MLAKLQERWYFLLVLMDAAGMAWARTQQTLRALPDILVDAETLRNKICALLLIASTLPVMLLEGDATATVFMAMIAVPTFFAKENWIYQKERRGCGSYTL